MTTNTQDALREALEEMIELVQETGFADSDETLRAIEALSVAPASEQQPATQGLPRPTLSWQQSAKDAGARIMTEQGTGHEMLCFNVGAFQQIVRQLAQQAADSPTGFDAEFLSKRLARVAKIAGVPMPDMTHEQIAGVAGTILGSIASKLEEQQAADSSDEKEQDVWIAFNSADDDEPVMFFTELPGTEFKERFVLKHYLCRLAPAQSQPSEKGGVK